ncbi:hypothetical protein [Alteromonas lipolytica]|uniref:Uncharacterized protein n=1 Tax=Alteromonas lipolytica TaxID=1856405 RepID=A0A1E8FAS4_9ALTE|nr:hypothetical protein [Alteromonas lipolytica]OFI33032.1 hypothetical protein BFC17_01795 [Alteromonas lipolytica]GGF63131.1 hypothetical protein GCM10011338_14470 [Alteromonas lipolytica]
MKRFSHPLVITALCSITLGGCASKDTLPKSAKNQFITEFYASVNAVQPVKFDSDMEQNVAAGAVIGAANSIGKDRDPFAAAIVSGGLFGLLTAIWEGNRTGYEYSLHAVDGDDVLVIVEERNAEVGDCVQVRVAGDVFIRPAAPDQCVPLEE